MVKVKQLSQLSLLLSLLLLLLTYGAEGWLYASWINQVLKQDFLMQLIEPARIGLLYVVAVIGISSVVVIFTSPMSLMTVGLNSWLKSDTRAFLSIFLGAFAFAIIVQRVDYFARFLVLVSAIFLGKLDLQLAGLSRWLCSVVLVILCWLGFTGGILAFYQW
jgi:hypothetical protein